MLSSLPIFQIVDEWNDIEGIGGDTKSHICWWQCVIFSAFFFLTGGGGGGVQLKRYGTHKSMQTFSYTQTFSDSRILNPPLYSMVLSVMGGTHCAMRRPF